MVLYRVENMNAPTSRGILGFIEAVDLSPPKRRDFPISLKRRNAQVTLQADVY
jgi:hypothetical protein